MKVVPFVVFAAFCVPQIASAQYFFGPPVVVVVDKPGSRKAYDPYYNAPKSYYTTKETKKKGNKVTKTTTVTNQYGQVVYKNKTVTKKKK